MTESRQIDCLPESVSKIEKVRGFWRFVIVFIYCTIHRHVQVYQISPPEKNNNSISNT